MTAAACRSGCSIISLKGHLAWDALAILVNHDRRNAHHVASIAGGRLQALNRVTGGAGQAVLIEGTIDS